MKSTAKILLAIVGLMILVSCSNEMPTGPIAPTASGADKTADQYLINNYIVQFDGRDYDGENTTFRYTVLGAGSEERASQFRLELVECAGELSSWEPMVTSRFYTDGDGVEWLKWPARIYGDDTEGVSFALSYPGNVPEGTVHAGVKVGVAFEFGEVPGPCAGSVSYAIGGTVFTDLDGDGLLDFDELGMANVAVELLDGESVVETQVTGAQGTYEFLASAGSYSLRLSYDGYPEQFNAELQNSFDASTPLEIEVSVGPDSAGNGFGFVPRTEEIIQDLESGELVSNGEDRIFWKRHIRWASLNQTHPDQVHTNDEIRAFIAAVQELYLTEIFQFTPGQELEEAYALLRALDLEPIDELAQQLLVTELNEVSGRGLVDDPELQDVLIAWGEAVWVDNHETARLAGGLHPGNGVGGQVSLANPELIPPAIDIFTLINTGGGGGVDEK